MRSNYHEVAVVEAGGWLYHLPCAATVYEDDIEAERLHGDLDEVVRRGGAWWDLFDSVHILSRAQVQDLQANQAVIDWADTSTNLTLTELIETHEGLKEHLDAALAECWDARVDLDVVEEVAEFLAPQFGRLSCGYCDQEIA